MKLYRTTQFRTESYLTDKSVNNETVNRLMMKHYKELHKLVTNLSYEDIFNDTYLIMTIKYLSDRDFILLFKYQYYYLYRRFQLLNYGRYEYNPKIRLENGSEIDYIDTVEDLTNETSINLELTNIADSDLINELKLYAVSEMKLDLIRRQLKRTMLNITYSATLNKV